MNAYAAAALAAVFFLGVVGLWMLNAAATTTIAAAAAAAYLGYKRHTRKGHTR